MPGNKSDYLEAAVLTYFLRPGAAAPTRPTNVYAALFTTMPSEDNSGGVEVSGGAYARQAVTFGAPSQSGGDAQVANTADVTFPVATANWGTVLGWGLFDAVSGGNLLYFNTLLIPQVINTNGQARFPAGQLTISEG